MQYFRHSVLARLRRVFLRTRRLAYMAIRCAVIGCPGQIGHISPAALSQTVKTKSSLGAPALANSSQLFERKPLASMRFFANSSTANGFTLPVGWLPAL